MYKIFKESRSIKWLLDTLPQIDLEPYYQRQGNIWDKKKKQKFIDSILNNFDVPKFYFHFRPDPIEGKYYDYSVIDGRQRIESILGFVNNDYPLDKDFKFLSDDYLNRKSTLDFNISGSFYRDLEDIYPYIMSKFLSYEIDIVFIDTDDPDKIEEMFLRLNSGAHLTNIEKRNVFGGKLMLEIKQLTSSHEFFQYKIKLINKRNIFDDIALKLLCLEHYRGPHDLTLKSINTFLEENKNYTSDINDSMQALIRKLNSMASIFNDHDKLLSAKNMIPIYYLLLDYCSPRNMHEFLFEFDQLKNQAKNVSEISERQSALMEFNRYNQQGADKKNSITARLEIMKEFYMSYKEQDRIHI